MTLVLSACSLETPVKCEDAAGDGRASVRHEENKSTAEGRPFDHQKSQIESDKKIKKMKRELEMHRGIWRSCFIRTSAAEHNDQSHKTRMSASLPIQRNAVSGV